MKTQQKWSTMMLMAKVDNNRKLVEDYKDNNKMVDVQVQSLIMKIIKEFRV